MSLSVSAREFDADGTVQANEHPLKVVSLNLGRGRLSTTSRLEVLMS